MAARNLGTMVSWWAQTRPDEIALWSDTDIVTWRDLERRTASLADALEELGIEPGQRVAALAENRVDWCAVAIAAFRVGAVFVPLNYLLASSELAYIIGHAGIDVVFASERHQDTADEAIAKANQHSRLIDLDGHEFAEWMSRESTRIRDHDGSDNEIAILQYTSGTTGRPKGVELSHANLLALGEMLFQIDPALCADLRSLLIAPLHFTGSVMSGFIAIYALGGTTFLVDGLDAGRSLELLARFEISMFIAVPVILTDVARHADFADADLHALRLGITGATVVPVNIMRLWQEKGVVFRQGYSLTEAGGYTCMPTVPEALANPERVGRAIGHTQVRVVDASGTPCADGEPGELLVRGPAVMRGYWRDPEATSSVLDGAGWLRTGDIAMRHPNGSLSIVDRLKDLIISGGINVYPAEIERVILQLDAVEEVAVTRMPDERWQEVPIAYVRTRSPIDATVLKKHCQSELASYKVPKRFIFVDEPLPRTSSGKVIKGKLALP